MHSHLHRWPIQPMLLLVTALTLLFTAACTALPVQPATAQQPTVAGDYYAGIVQVKFRDAYRIRLRRGTLVDLNGAAPQAALHDLMATTQAGQWTRAHAIDEATLDTLRARGQANTGEALVDINNYYHLLLPAEWDAAHAIAQLQTSPLVERVLRIPVAHDAAFDLEYVNPGGITGNIATDKYQRYLDPAPDGIDARYAWLGGGGTGAGIGICDVEQDYNPNHADLPAIALRGATISFPGQDDNHGTAVLGIVAGRDDGLGVTGIAHAATLYFAYGLYNNVNHTPDGINNTFFLHNAITRCTAAVGSGGVILIEAQIGGPNRPPNPAEGDQSGLVPTEWDKSVYDVIKLAVANGITVVEAAGNGAENLDSGDYQTGNGGHFPFLSANDSGAIIVGAGKSPYWGANARIAHDYSNYGQTVDLHGWGDSIVTTGYGTLYPGGTNPDVAQKNQWYATSFGGTSGASPIVTGAVAVIQSTYKQVNGSYMTPAQVRTLLRTTGTPQIGSKNIGPLPNLRAAIEQIYDVANVGLTVAAPTVSPPGGTYAMPLQVQIGYGTGQNSGNTNIRYTLDGSEPTPDSFVFLPSQGDILYLNYGATLKVKAFQYDPTTQRSFDSPTVTHTYVSSTPKVATPVITPGSGTYNQPHQVTLSTSTPGATIRYRTDGRVPSFFYPGTDYTGPITLNAGSYEIVARGYKDGYYKSDAVYSGEIVVNALTLPSPTIYPDSGTFNGSATVYIGSTVLGATIRYTTNGTEPTANSPIYAEPITLVPENNATTVYNVRARVFLDGYTPSEPAQASLIVVAQADPPTINPNGGEHTGSVQVSMSTPTAGGIIRYTTNGANPTGYSTQYTGPFNLGIGVHTVKARTFLQGATASTTTEATFTVYDPNTEQVATPRIIPDGGNHTISVTVRMETDTEGANIFYTWSDTGLPTDPTEGDNPYNPANPPVLTANENNQFLKVRAFKNGMTDSAVASAVLRVFTATNTVVTPTITLPGGTYYEPIEVEIDIQRDPPFFVPTIFYTTDGTDPFVPFNDPGDDQVILNLDEPTQVKALGAQLGWYNSPIVDETYLFECATPSITPGGVYSQPVQVTLATITPGATLRYTTDGSEPTAASTEYTTPIDVNVGNTTVRAKCFRTDFDPSPTVVESFVVEPPPVAPSFSAEPDDQQVSSRSSVTFTIAAGGTPTPTIQWQLNGIDIAGENEPELVVHDVGDGNEGEYRAVVANAAGTITSTAASLTLPLEAIAGLSAANDGPVNVGEPVTLEANATAGTDVTYTWDFGDGSGGAGRLVSHTYTAPGIYIATVTATNELGADSAQTEVIVGEILYLPGLLTP